MKYLSLNTLETQGLRIAKLSFTAEFYTFGSARSGFESSACCACLGGAGTLHIQAGCNVLPGAVAGNQGSDVKSASARLSGNNGLLLVAFYKVWTQITISCQFANTSMLPKCFHGSYGSSGLGRVCTIPGSESKEEAVSALGPGGLVGVGGQAMGGPVPRSHLWKPLAEPRTSRRWLPGLRLGLLYVVPLVFHSQERPGACSADSGFYFQRIPCEIIQ